MPHIAEGMVQLNVPIPEELRDLLDTEIIQRCGYPKRGVLGEVVTEALREYLYKRHAHTQIMQKKAEAQRFQNRTTVGKYELLKSQIKSYGEEHDFKISPVVLKEMIRQTFGNDTRTINKYLSLLEDDFFTVPDNGYYLTPKPIRGNSKFHKTK